MRLTLKNIHAFLLDKGLIDAKSIVNGDYMASQGQTRNIFFRISRKKNKSLFVKQLNSFEHTNTYVLQKDATSLWIIKNEPAFKKLSKHVPEYFGYDTENQVLITEFMDNARNLEEYYREKQDIGDNIMEQLADILASYHFEVGDKLKNSRSVQFFPKQVSWALTLTEMPAQQLNGFMNSGQGPNPVVQMLLSHERFKEMLSGLKNEWRHTSLIHGDIKWMNFLVQQLDDKEVVKLIDWEIADIGDPIWDVAGIFQAMITSKLVNYNAQAAPVFTPTSFTGIGELDEVWPWVRKFWDLYEKKRKPGQEPEETALPKAVKFTAARLIQTAIEHNMMMTQIQPNATKILQASYAILDNVDTILKQLEKKETVPA